jgi:hypothetical protein
MGGREISIFWLGHSVMTSETSFALDHTSTWRTLAPAIDLLVRKVNVSLYEREFAVLRSDISPSRRGLVNETAFNVFCSRPRAEGRDALTDADVDSAFHDARRKIAVLEKIPIDQVAGLSETEVSDCTEQVKRIRVFFLSRIRDQGTVEVRPRFPGSGFIDTCEGDIYFDDVLFEVKAGQRPYKSGDFKQLLTYAALNYAGGARPLNRIGLFNPRMGTSFAATLDAVAIEIAGGAVRHVVGIGAARSPSY